MPNVGDTYSHEFSFTQDDVVKFAEVSGDNNPIHLDPEFAATTQFKVPIIHGALAASIFSKVLGTEFPGEGTIYLKQESNFKRPMTVDTSYTADFEILEVSSRGHAKIATSIKDSETGKVTVSGEAMVMIPS